MLKLKVSASGQMTMTNVQVDFKCLQSLLILSWRQSHPPTGRLNGRNQLRNQTSTVAAQVMALSHSGLEDQVAASS